MRRPAPTSPGDRSADDAQGDSPSETLFAGLFGLLLGIGLLKFGNPVILDHLVETPKSIDEWRAFAWPIRFGYGLLALVTLAGLVIARSGLKASSTPLALGLLGAWFAWQVAATFGSQDRPLSLRILPHFAACTVSFALGHWILSQVRQPRTFWLCLVAGLIGVIGMGFDQHFGGLEATRKMILQNAAPASLSPEYIARIQSRRIFSTLVYPNALAGVLLLLTPAAIVLAAEFGRRWGTLGTRLVAGLLLAASVATLVWSGSKTGWLIAMGLAITVLARSSIPALRRWPIIVTFAIVGLAAFAFVFREKLSRGATSVSARLDYWSAAVRGFQERPVLGHGPGVFKKVYSRVKRPESEMAQLAHNDPLQQATDSGLPGFLAYVAFVIGSLRHLIRAHLLPRPSPAPPSRLVLAVSLGLLAWFTHGLVEFGLYIPASSWTAFALLGWALAQKPSASALGPASLQSPCASCSSTVPTSICSAPANPASTAV